MKFDTHTRTHNNTHSLWPNNIHNTEEGAERQQSSMINFLHKYLFWLKFNLYWFRIYRKSLLLREVRVVYGVMTWRIESMNVHGMGNIVFQHLCWLHGDNSISVGTTDALSRATCMTWCIYYICPLNTRVCVSAWEDEAEWTRFTGINEQFHTRPTFVLLISISWFIFFIFHESNFWRNEWVCVNSK